MTDTISMSVANTVFTPAASGISIENEYNGSAKREIEKKKPSPPVKLIRRNKTSILITTFNFLFIASKLVPDCHVNSSVRDKWYSKTYVVCMDLTPNVPNLRISSDISIVYIP